MTTKAELEQQVADLYDQLWDRQQIIADRDKELADEKKVRENFRKQWVDELLKAGQLQNEVERQRRIIDNLLDQNQSLQMLVDEL